MKNSWKVFLVMFCCIFTASVITEILNYDFQMSGVDAICFYIWWPICVYLGYMPNKVVNKTRKK